MLCLHCVQQSHFYFAWVSGGLQIRIITMFEMPFGTSRTACGIVNAISSGTGGKNLYIGEAYNFGCLMRWVNPHVLLRPNLYSTMIKTLVILISTCFLFCSCNDAPVTDDNTGSKDSVDSRAGILRLNDALKKY